MEMLAYIEWRDGTGVKHNNVDVCGSGTAVAWTKCCDHEPVVFLCSNGFKALDLTQPRAS